MRTSLLVVAALSLATTAYAGDAQNGPQNAAVKSPNSNTSQSPVKGANSFTRGEASSHIAAKGYTHVRGLTKDSSGVWRGTAMKDGASVHVSLDYQGNVNTN